jgi:hypothetical protein
MGLRKVMCMSGLCGKLRDLNAAVQALASSSPNLNKGDTALVEEALHACDVGTELMLNNSIVQAKYACVYAEACVAVIQGDERSTDRLRKLLEDLLKPERQI